MAKQCKGYMMLTSEEMNEVLEENIKTESGSIMYPKYIGQKLICKEGELFVACDNEEGCAWTAEFKTRSAAIKWLGIN